ncbi:hypothetical protein [Nostoc sp.]|uniref:hypothetical protein n=1 Tax=Nostoc sp. TaxID=1180 RepID=UPI002FFB81BC
MLIIKRLYMSSWSKSLVKGRVKDKNFSHLIFSQSKPSNFGLVNHSLTMVQRLPSLPLVNKGTQISAVLY